MKQFSIHMWKHHQELVVLAITSFFLLAGVVQYAIGLTYVLRLTPVVIGIIAALVMLYWHAPPRRKASLIMVAFLVGFIAEIVGVNTGLLFGDYTYGSVMGLKIAGVPILIGITWALVTIAAWQIVSMSPYSRGAKIFLAACLVVIFDLILEQYATAFGLWQWDGGIIPLKNYISWFIVAAAITTSYSLVAKQSKPNIYGACVLPVLALYFWLMLLVR